MHLTSFPSLWHITYRRLSFCYRVLQLLAYGMLNTVVFNNKNNASIFHMEHEIQNANEYYDLAIGTETSDIL